MKKGSFITAGNVHAGVPAIAPLEAFTLHLVHVLFGSPGRNCAGSGICKATEIKDSYALSNPVTTSCKGGMAKVKAIKPDHLVFYFLIASMCRALIQQCFDDGFFVVESDATVELAVHGHTVKHHISAGVYPVTQSTNYLIVHFQSDG